MMAVTEAVNVIQGKNPFQKLSEQMLISCVPEKTCGDNSDVLWSWALNENKGNYQTEEAYPYNRTCNNYREQTLAPDGTRDGYPGTCRKNSNGDDDDAGKSHRTFAYNAYNTYGKKHTKM